MTVNLKSRRELFWDFDLIEESRGIRIQRHKPIRKNIALTCDKPWEGVTCGYPSVMKVGDKYRLYYRASGQNEMAKGESFCIAESDDGKTFERVNLGMYEFGECKETNIHHREERFIDNFTVHYDTNPNCPEDEKYKALSLMSWQGEEKYMTVLGLYVSSDGLNFDFVRQLPIKGVFDTHNVLIWDEKEELYRIYMRDFHNQDGSECTYEPTDAMNCCIRDVRITKSKDLIEWTVPKRLTYEDGEDIQLYTNQIIKYPRADIYFGMPTRYIDRRDDKANFKYLSDQGGWRKELLEKGNRIGSAMTDCVLMYSKDGLRFRRDGGAFAAPEYEEGRNWYYGDCYFSHGLIETVSDENPEVTEYSMFTGQGYRQRAIEFVRYTVRLDGFYSLSADYCGGEFMTVPMTLGDGLNINFKTSAFGGVRIIICDKMGEALSGYDSGVLFGNSVKRQVDFEKPLSALRGKEVKLKFIMKDAEIYSIASDI